jgi:hypothetical protein
MTKIRYIHHRGCAWIKYKTHKNFITELQRIQNNIGLKNTEDTLHGREYKVFIFTALRPETSTLEVENNKFLGSVGKQHRALFHMIGVLDYTASHVSRLVKRKFLRVHTRLSCICKAEYTERPTSYRTRHFFDNFTTNEDIATKFEADLPHCVRNVTTS